jgi:nitrite reductase (NO-forming)
VVKVDLSTPELVGALDTKSSYQYLTFNGRVPGPFVRVRVGDMVEVRLTNPEDSLMIHSVDFHGATGPGGGAEFTQTDPGDAKTVSFRALIPGIYVYHCATPSVANHIANGMYGLLLVEPEGGLPRVDREFYVMQGEIYTVAPYGNVGPQEFDYEKMMAESPEYFVFNGAVEALAHRHPLRARAGEKVRIYFGVGGPNFTSSFHVIGEIFDAVYQGGSLTSPPITGVQTVSVPPGGAIAVDFKIDRAGRYILVDHALSRAERGLLGFLIVEGPENDAIMHEGPVE